MTGRALSTGQVAAFASPGFALAALALPLAAILPPLYAELGISLTAVGTIFMLARFFDGLTDPLCGVLGDRVSTRWGRRRPAIVLGIPILLIGVWWLFMPPDPATETALLISLLIMYVGWTLLSISHTAWAAELSGDYDQRTRIMGAVQICGLTGAVGVLLLPAVMDQLYPDGGMRMRGMAMGLLILIATPITFLLAFRSVGESPGRPATNLPLGTAWRAIRDSHGLRRLLLADLLMGLQGGINGAVHFFFVIHVLKLPEAASLFLVLIFAMGLACVPLFVWISKRFGKHQTLCFAALQSTVATGTFFILPSGSFWWVFLIFLMVGVNFGAKDMLMRSIMADIVDQDRLATGVDRSALYYSMLTLTSKIAAALAVGIIYPVLDLVGFDPTGDNSQATLDAVRIVVATSPTAITLLVALIMWRFPIGRAEQASLRARIEAQASTTG